MANQTQLASINKIQIISRTYDLAVQANPASNNFTVEAGDISKAGQLFQAIWYPDGGGFALICAVEGTTYALSAPSGVEWPQPAAFIFDSAYLWQFGNPQNTGEGLNAVRTTDYALTIDGAKPVAPGSRIQMYTWDTDDHSHQHWRFQTVV